MDNNKIKYEIVNEIGIISERKGGWKKELNRVSWNGNDPKYDLREWNESHEKMGKGITLTEIELRQLKKVVDSEIEYLDGVIKLIEEMKSQS